MSRHLDTPMAVLGRLLGREPVHVSDVASHDVGARTPGAADHVTPIVLAERVRVNLPRAHEVDAVTGANWEGTGVRPDLPCEEAEALERALDLLRAG